MERNGGAPSIAHPDSIYRERHMHRGCNRSRKPVESHTISHPSLSVNSLAPTSGSGTSPNNFQNIPFGSPMTDSQGSNTSQLQMDPTPYGMGNKDYRQQQWKESKAASKQRDRLSSRAVKACLSPFAEVAGIQAAKAGPTSDCN